MKPFQMDAFTPVKNAVFDEIMPRVSPSAWKVLCVAIRQTWGWDDPSSPTGRRESDIISYTQFQEKTGISSRNAISAALKDLLGQGILLRVQIGKHPKTKKPIYSYHLNSDYELPNGMNIILPNGMKTAPVNGMETILTKERNKQTKAVGDVVQQSLDKQQEQILAALQNLGVTESMARDLAQKCNVDQVRSWIEYVRKNDQIKNIPAFVVSQLRLGNIAPQPKALPSVSDSEDRKSRYLGGKYAGQILH